MRSITTTFSIIIAFLTVAQGSPIHRNLKLGKREIIGAGQRRLEEEYASSKAPYYEYYSSKSPNDTSAVASAASYFNMDYIKENKQHHPVGIVIGVVAGISLIILGASKAKKRKVNNTQLSQAICQQDHDLESRFDSVAKLTTDVRS
uniref:Uncharacterized protein n=1 Tax=Chaetoceros debilis TaxID=122233 RepID=A0A7S3V8S7_9STRA|mmetsp:Transcript_11683/g.17711  ORF Transcript_11683/g.17711 Transcript_11683/m.17711 type:complete len:147 (+) Transcript_11683:123-563(+)|eukprot:CAMPEP_0194075000 /NCGR_PEP_ID=MMETSP0149-20130528/2057_1 /TAXON_ID=122233 /ORGANISM="Chaetoceros debilis, Strain MM31A-1" /LENGTH=146 /DNA_ID=CAMNT_0038755337 /DNA_START=75 /DNA_END=515 /DNA_ORIENTATION=-